MRAMFAIALCVAIASCAGTSPQREQADVLLLGEVHDNPQGHAARLALKLPIEVADAARVRL